MQTPQENTNNRTETRSLLILSGIVDFILGLIKVAVGLFSNSYALIVDGIHSLSDLGTDLMVWFFSEIGSQAPDTDHPYGHARFETFGILVLGCLLILLATLLVYDSILRLVSLEDYVIPTWPALVIAVISIATKEWLYQITLKLGKKTRSRLLQANAWHHRTDALSSILVLVGIIGALSGFPWLELLAAIGVALMIAMIGWSLSRQSVSELVDTALSESYVDDIRQRVRNVEGVSGVHSIRTRRMGADAHVDIHLQVNPLISVSEGHHIGEWVTKTLLTDFPEINDVIVHIDAEDDEYLEEQEIGYLAPLRREVRQSLLEAWVDILSAEEIQNLTLHYLNNTIHVELFMQREHEKFKSVDQLEAQLRIAANHLRWLNKVSIWQKLIGET